MRVIMGNEWMTSLQMIILRIAPYKTPKILKQGGLESSEAALRPTLSAT